MLRGAFAGPERDIPLGPEPGLNLKIFADAVFDANAIYALLRGPSHDRLTGVRVTRDEALALGLWISLREGGVCAIWADSSSADGTMVPGILREGGGWRIRATGGLLGNDGLAVATELPGLATPEDRPEASEALEMFVRTYGSADALAERLTELIVAWYRAGRPSTEVRGVRAYPIGTSYFKAAHELAVPRKLTTLVFDWRDSSMGPQWRVKRGM